MESRGAVNKWELIEQVETPLVGTNTLLLLRDCLSKARVLSPAGLPSSQGKSTHQPARLWRS